MKKRLLILCFYCTCYFSQAQITEDFSDGDFTNNPIWVSSNESGNGVDFLVTAEELQTNGPDDRSEDIYLSTNGMPSFAGNSVTWEFRVRYANAPSGSNRILIYLLSNQTDLNDAPEGYYVRLGESGSDDGIDLYKTSSSTPLIADPNPTIVADINASIRVTRDDQGNWTMEADNTGGNNFIEIGSANDTEFLDGDVFGLSVSHTSTRNQSFFFDDISVSAISTDNTPPAVLSIETILPNQLEVIFSEEIQAASAISTANYDLNNGFGQPTSVELTSSNSVELLFDQSFNSADYVLSVSDIADVNGNILSNQTIDFTVFIPDIASLRDVIVTEIMADPEPSIGLLEADYIEIQNISQKSFDLANWSLADSNSETMLSSYILLPDDILILCSSTRVTDFAPYGNVLGVTSFQNFNNAGDDVVIRNEAGVLIDRVEYEDDWYQAGTDLEGGVSLELINRNNVCGGIANWRASENSLGGTPGSLNSINDDQSGAEIPMVEEVRVVNENTIQLLFSENLDTLTINESAFTFTPQATISQLDFTENVLTITVDAAFGSGVEYQITITELTDCTGNVISAEIVEFKYISNPDLSFKDVVMTEIMANPNDETTSPNAEYVELYNNTSVELSLANWEISDQTTIGILPNYILSPGQYVVITREDDLVLFQGIAAIGLDQFPTLNNSGDNISITSGIGEMLDAVGYNSSWYRSSIKDDGGFSLEIIDPTDPCSDENNWTASEDNSGGTPGQPNSVLSIIPDNIGPSLETAFGISPDSVMLIFSELLDAESVASATYNLSGSLTIVSVVYDNDRTIFLKLSDDSLLQSGERYDIEVENLADCPGNIISTNNSATFSLIEQAEKGDVILNEILFNPRPDGNDFVEIYNKSDKFISLQNWALANGSFDDRILNLNTIRSISEEQYILEPKSHLAITDDVLNIKNFYPKSAEMNFIEMSSLPSFPDEEGLVALLSDGMDTLDFFMYTEEMHAAVISDEEGVSLERIDFTSPTNETDNWISAAASEDFATPGYINSQARANTSFLTGDIVVEPKVVVPDGDGVADFATISYAFDQPGNVATVTIFDIQGRVIKRLAENDFLSNEGFYTWDATSDDGNVVRMGYYIVYFKVFNTSGNTEEFKKKIAIGARF